MDFGNRILVKTSRGNVLATHVIHATNAYALEFLPELKPFLKTVRGQVGFNLHFLNDTVSNNLELVFF